MSSTIAIQSHWKNILVVTFFAIAMAALEGAVVVYLRALYYPGEFTVAFRVIDERIVVVEILREIATIIMLLAIGYLSGKNFKERLAYFLLSFAVWDIFYYVWLKIFLNWPATLLDWDILFLIPFTWLGPVLAPVICSLTMIVLAWMLLRADEQQKTCYRFWTLLIAGCVIILYTFMQDYLWLLVDHNLMKDYATLLRNEKFVSVASGYVPSSYSWIQFIFGELLIIGSLWIFSRNRYSYTKA